VLASADYQLFAHWYLIFASNESMLRCTDQCRYEGEINADNWYEILQREGLLFWRPDPDDDPGGYRTLMVLQLAEKYDGVPGLYAAIMSAKSSVILSHDNCQKYRDSTYTFAYRSSPIPPGQRNIKLPDEINLGNRDYAEYYKNAVVQINGKKPGEKLTLHGEPMLFGITIPRSSKNEAAAVR
jgi:molybdate/tungstate transport system substrate-binding protein